MKRAFDRLADGKLDLLVVGGGIYGAWAAYDAALRGLSVAIVERRDWGAGTSSASSKLVHGGLRYLERLWLPLVRKTLTERGRLASLGPHRVRPLRFLLPVYRGDRRGRLALGAGLTLYDALSWGSTLGRHRRLPSAELVDLCPGLRTDDLTGGFEFADCATDDARFTLEIVSGAVAAGAVAANHAEVERFLDASGRVEGALVRDRETGRTVEVRAAVVLDATGPWSDQLRGTEGASRLTRASKGVHLVLPPLPGNHAIFLWARSDGRPIFLIPWYGRTLLGTTDTDYTGDPDRVRVEDEDVRYLLAEANRALRGAELREENILGTYAGLRSLPNVSARSTSAISREWSLEEPRARLLVSVGGKLTSARADAALAIDRVVTLLERKPGESPTASRPFPWRPEEPFESWIAASRSNGVALGLDPETAINAAYRYGSTVTALHDLLRARPTLARRIEPSTPFCLAEIVHAVEHESARTLEDIFRRRIPLTLLTRLDETTLASAADLASTSLSWSKERREAELRALAVP